MAVSLIMIKSNVTVIILDRDQFEKAAFVVHCEAMSAESVPSHAMKSLVNQDDSAANEVHRGRPHRAADIDLPPMPVSWGRKFDAGAADDETSAQSACEVSGVSGLEQMAAENQWHPEDLDWEMSNPSGFAANDVVRMLSPVVHLKQAGLLASSAVVLGAADMQVKRFAASQSFDLARHIEVLQRYLGGEGKVLAMPVALQALLRGMLSQQRVPYLLAGMNMVVLGTAYGAMRQLNRLTQDALLKSISHHILRDEARHVSFGRRYLTPLVWRMPAAERDALAGFVFDALTLLQRTEAECAWPGCPVNFLSMQHVMMSSLIRTGLITSDSQQRLQARGICIPVDIEVRESLRAADEAAGSA